MTETIDDSTRALGAVAAIGFAVLVVLVVLLAVTEENLVGTAAGLVGIVTGIVLGLYLRRTEPEVRESAAGDPAAPSTAVDPGGEPPGAEAGETEGRSHTTT